MNKETYIGNKKNILNELNLRELTNESEYYDSSKNNFAEQFNWFVEYYEYFIIILLKKYKPLKIGHIGITKDGRVYFNLGKMNYDLTIDNIIFDHNHNRYYPEKSEIKKYNCYIRFNSSGMFEGNTIDEYLEEIKNHFENNTIETIINGVEIIKSKKIIKEQMQIYSLDNIGNIENITFKFENEELGLEQLDHMFLKLGRYSRKLRNIKKIIFEKLN